MNEAADFKSAVSTYFTTQAKLRSRFAIGHCETIKLPVRELFASIFWRRGPESNRASRICNPVHNRFVTAPFVQPNQCIIFNKPMQASNFPVKKDSILKCCPFNVEREKSLELSTSTLARLRSTN